MHASLRRIAGAMAGAVVGLAGGALLALAGAGVAHADSTCTLTWAGPDAGGDMAVAANWSPSRTPVTGDVVCSSASGILAYTGSLGTTSLSEIRLTGPFNLSGGEIDLTDGSATGDTVAGLSNTGGTLRSVANLADNGDFTWTNGSFYSTGTPTLSVAAGHTATITNPFYFDHWTLDTSSPLTLNPGSWYLQQGGSVIARAGLTTVGSTGVIDTGGAGTITLPAGSTLTANDSGATANLAVPVSISGPVAVNGGTLALTGTSTAISGPSTVSTGAFLSINSATAALSNTVGGAGTLKVTGGSLTDPADVTAALAISGGSATFNGAIHPAGIALSGGDLYLNGTTNTTTGMANTGGNLRGTGNLADNGDFTWTNGSFYSTGTPTLSVAAGHTATITNPFYFDHWTLDTSSPLTLNPGSWYLQQGGSVIARAGLTTVGSTGVIDTGGAGTITLPAGSTLTANDSGATANLAVPVSISGPVAVNGGTLALTGTSTAISGPSTVSTGAFLSINSATAALSNTVGGAGTLKVTGGSLTDPADVTAALAISGGSATFNGAIHPAGIALSGGDLYLNGTTNTTTGMANTGGNLRGTGNLADNGDFSWTNGSFYSTGTPTLSVAAGHTATITNPFYLDHWALAFASPLSVNPGSFYLQNGGSLKVLSTATVSDGAIVEDTGAAGPITVATTGVLTKAATAGMATLQPSVVNAGVVRSPGGTLDLHALSGTGTLDLSTGTTKIDTAFAPAKTAKAAVTVAGTTPGINLGRLVLPAGGAIKGTLTITTDPSYTPVSGTVYPIASNGGSGPAVTGKWSPVTQTITPSGLAYTEASAAGVVSLKAAKATDFSLALTGAASDANGTPASYTATVTNHGPNATSATLTVTFPSAMTLGTLPAGCTSSGQKVTCKQASLAPGNSVSWTLSATPTATGKMTISAIDKAGLLDPTTTDDAATVVTTVS